MNEYFCDCESCLNLEFSSCKKPVTSVGEIDNDFLEEYSTPSYVSLLSCNASDPVYFVFVEKKSQATDKLQDRDDLYLEG